MYNIGHPELLVCIYSWSYDLIIMLNLSYILTNLYVLIGKLT